MALLVAAALIGVVVAVVVVTLLIAVGAVGLIEPQLGPLIRPLEL